MENKNNEHFDRMQYLKTAVNQFINKETAESVNKVYRQLIEQLPAQLEQNQIKRKILETCKDIFLLSSFREAISNARQQGTPKTELVNIVVNKLSSRVFERQYNMSKLNSDGMLSTKLTYDGSTQKIVNYEPITENIPPKTLYDLDGNTIDIQCIGILKYTTRSAEEYIYKYRIKRNLGNNNIITDEVFTEIDLNQLSEENMDEYYNAVVGELLRYENIKYSCADGYIGELTVTSDPQTRLKLGEEQFEENEQKTKIYSYRYQISPNYALYYDCEKFEAIKAYIQQEQIREDDER